MAWGWAVARLGLVKGRPPGHFSTFLTIFILEIKNIFLHDKGNNLKIICIGGSINIISGLEQKVPRFLYHFEFIWRLRYETFRRLKRLLITFKSYTIGKFIERKLENLHTKFIR